MVLLFIYITGVIFAYGRVLASEMDTDYCLKNTNLLPIYSERLDSEKVWCIFLFSWVMFFSMVIIYFFYKERYFLKFSNRKIWNIYYKQL